MSTYIPFILLFVGGSVLTIGDIIMKKWVSNQNWQTFLFGLLVYLIGLVFLGLSFKYKNIAVASTIFVIFNIITLLLVSWFYFKETINPLQLAGVGLGIMAIVLLELS
ncbi:MAG: SMR family transporter [Candidatus Paceibacteria bacterium]